MKKKKDIEQQNILIFQAKTCITEIDNLILVYHLNESSKNFGDIRFAQVKFPDFSQFRVEIP